MIPSTKGKTFVLKFSNHVHNTTVNNWLTREHSQALQTDSYITLVSKMDKSTWLRGDQLAGIIYQLDPEGERLPNQDRLYQPTEVITNLRQYIGPNHPIVATYYPDEDNDAANTTLEQKLLEAGADAVLSHPFVPRDLYAKIELALNKYNTN